jgi:hypothetical protein
MMNHHPTPIVLALVALAGLAGCKRQPVAVQSPPAVVNAASAVGTLSQDQWKTFCQAMEPRQNESVEERCRRDAFTVARSGLSPASSDAQLQTWCRTSYASCLGSPPALASGCTQRPVQASCQATVGEVEACAGAVKELRRAALAKVPSCEALTVAIARDTSVEAKRADLLALAPCKSLHTKCASLFR